MIWPTLKSPRLSWLRRVVLLDVPVRPGLRVVPGGSEPLPGMEGVGGHPFDPLLGSPPETWGGAVRSVTTPTREVGLLTAEGASDGRVEVVPPCCDLAVGDFEDTHDRHRYLDTILTA